MTTETLPASRKPISNKTEKTITLTETQEILADPETMTTLRKGAQETKEGKHISLARMKKELGL